MNVIEGQNSLCTGLAFRACTAEKPAKREFSDLLKYTRRLQEQSAEEEMSEAEAEVKQAKECVRNYQTALIKEILYGTSNEQYQAEKKNNKKYKLFQSDNGVFGDKTLEEQVNPPKDRKTTWNCAESKKLTRQQLRYLKEKYNVFNLSGEDCDGFLMELIEMQILSGKEAEEILDRRLPIELLLKRLLEDEAALA